MKKIMVVDDENDQIFTIRHMFETYSKDYEIIGASNGKECLDILKKDELPDLIILDIMMPEMTGWEVFDRIKNTSKWSKIPILFLSARIDQSSTDAGNHLGEEYVTKPFNGVDLINKINKILKI